MQEKRKQHEEEYALKQEKAYKKLNPDECRSKQPSPIKNQSSSRSIRTTSVRGSFEFRNKTRKVEIKKKLDSGNRNDNNCCMQSHAFKSPTKQVIVKKASKTDNNYMYRDWRRIYQQQQENISDIILAQNMTPDELEQVAGDIKPTTSPTPKFVQAKNLAAAPYQLVED